MVLDKMAASLDLNPAKRKALTVTFRPKLTPQPEQMTMTIGCKAAAEASQVAEKM
jgi:hypothetical protein